MQNKQELSIPSETLATLPSEFTTRGLTLKPKLMLLDGSVVVYNGVHPDGTDLVINNSDWLIVKDEHPDKFTNMVLHPKKTPDALLVQGFHSKHICSIYESHGYHFVGNQDHLFFPKGLLVIIPYPISNNDAFIKSGLGDSGFLCIPGADLQTPQIIDKVTEFLASR